MSSRSLFDISDKDRMQILNFNLSIVQAEKIKAEVYVNQDKSLSDLPTLIKHSFLLYVPLELLMSLIIFVIELFCSI
jgi:hypothetical protein